MMYVRRTSRLALLVVLTASVLLSAAAPALAATQTFTAEADAFDHSLKPNSNYGTGSTLKITGSDVTKRGYVRFLVSGLSGTVTKATLRLYAANTGRVGLTVRPTAIASWDEKALTFSNAPSLGPAISSGVSVVSGRWSTADVTSAVLGNGAVSLGLTTTDTIELRLSSREAGASRAPQLVVES